MMSECAPPVSKGVFCVDVHAHFFNASDVTVQGYLAGPVAHSAGAVQRKLLGLLAPLADELASLAPTARKEYEYLDDLRSQAQLKSGEEIDALLDKATARHRQEQSTKLFDMVNTPQGRGFVDEFNRIQSEEQRKGVRRGEWVPARLDQESVARAMALGEVPRVASKDEFPSPGEAWAHAEGLLAFVGYMLSFRWANLRSYRTAFSTHGQSLGVNRVLGSLVDFDRWLDCAPRSAHEDQMRLHARLSKLSGGYMLPLIAYNPWTDIAENGRSLRLVKEAVTKYGFVGAKIYPANGFRPWGNTTKQRGFRPPPPREIDRALEAFWDTCIELGIPVMAHTSQSMGKDYAHDALGGPEGWEALVEAYGRAGKAPLVNLGHFGGDTGGHPNDWTMRMARLMAREHGDRVFGDLGYWSELQCGVVGPDRCRAAADRLRSVLGIGLGGQQRVADRIMFGSDWLMLSKEPRWPDYAAGLFTAIADIAPDDVANIFGQNAAKCFGARLNQGAR